MNDELRSEIEQAISNKKSNKRFLSGLKKHKPADLDKAFRIAHEEAFERIDCLDCANCCKTTSPIFRDVDIERISRFLKIKPGQFIEQNLHLDHDGDYVLNESPCLFLGDDNKCSIYDLRPLACKEYPHTNRKNMHQILGLTHKNTMVCPAVNSVVENLKKSLD
jgi:Fe-S-cluster containining protein